MKYLSILFVCFWLSACSQNKTAENNSNLNQEKKMATPITKSDEEWKKTLTPEQYSILREKGTERPFSGKYYDHTAKGVYSCAACNAELFRSDTKFDAHCGWPSFYEAMDKSKIIEKRDLTHGMIRIEVMCANCGGHLGHVFDDGPKPTGLRYCINSVSINFKEEE
ncbi:MAG: peptide-methionine (R)-S-oxide reductase MsrB [Bacteroidota bacterium]